jgi:hypothetical protein
MMLRWLTGLFNKGRAARVEASGLDPSATEEHALIVQTIGVQITMDEVHAIEEALEAAFATAGIGIVDGHDFAVDGNDALFYMYGPDANAMFAVARPILLEHASTATAEATLRFGDVRNERALVEKHLVAMR